MTANDERPLSLLVLADLCATRPVSHPFALTAAAGFDELLADLAPAIDVPGVELRLELHSLRDFEPPALLERLPSLAPLRALRAELQPFLDGKRPEAELRALLDARAGDPALAAAAQLCRSALDGAPPTTAPAPPERERQSVDRILDLVATPGAEERAASAIGSLVGAVGRRGRARATVAPAPPTRPPLAAAVLEVQALIERQLQAVLAHPQLQRAEATWRGLKLLVDRTDFRRHIRLEVLHVERPRAQVDETLASVLEASDHDAILIAWELVDPEADTALLEWLGAHGERLQAPVLFSVAPAFLGLEQGADARAPRDLGAVFEQPRLARWNALRAQECARWLAGAFNRVLLRAPAVPGRELWGSAAWLLGALIVRSFARCGWPTEIAGTTGGRVDDLPVRELAVRGRGTVQAALELGLDQQAAQDLARGGLIALFPPENSDRAFALAAPTLHRPADLTPASPRARSIGLAYQLLAARVARAVADVKPELVGLGSPDATRARLGRFLQRLLETTGPGSSVDVRLTPDPDAAETLLATLALRTGKAVLGGVGLELNFRLAG